MRALLVCLTVAAALLLVPVAAVAEPQHLEGALHEHSAYSDGFPGSRPADYFASGKGHGLDFMGSSEHSDNADVPTTLSEYCVESQETFAQCQRADQVEPENSFRKWDATLEQAAAATGAGFTAFRGFEYTNDRQGHINVFFSRHDVNAKGDGSYATIERFYDWLTTSPADGGGADGLATFNHPGDKGFDARDGAFNFDDFAHVPGADSRMVGLEVFNGGSDFGSAPGHEAPPEGWYARALDRGWHVGAVGAEDAGHKRGDDWGGPALAKTVILAEENTRASLMAAMRARRMYAVRRPGIRMAFTVGDAAMGSRLTRPSGSALAFAADVDDPAGPVSLELVTSGGQVVATGTDTLEHARPVSASEDWYFLRARGADGIPVAYSSPVWVTPEAAGRSWLAGDLHVHSCYSPEPYCPAIDGPPDGETEPRPGATIAQRFEQAAQRGLDFTAITDHNDVRSVTDPGFDTAGVIGLPGYESSLRGHAQLLGTETLRDNGDQGAATIAAQADTLRAGGGVFQANHPAEEIEADFTCSDIDTDGSPLHWSYGTRVGLDAVELWNPTASTFYAEKFYDCLLAAGQRPAVTGGSDSHDLALSYGVGPGNPTTWVLTADRTRAGVLEAIRDGRTTITSAAPGAAGEGASPLLLEADADEDGTFEAVVGDEVPAGTPMRARSDDADATGVLRIVADGASTERRMTAGAPVAFDAPAGAASVRVTLNALSESAVQGEDCRPGRYFAVSTCSYDRAMLGMTSPIFVAAPEDGGDDDDDGTGGGDDDGGSDGGSASTDRAGAGGAGPASGRPDAPAPGAFGPGAGAGSRSARLAAAKVLFARRQTLRTVTRRRGIVLRVRCRTACRLDARLLRGRVPLGRTATRRLAANRTATLRVPIDARSLRALRRTRTARLGVRLRTSAADGRSTTRIRRLTVRSGA